MNNMIKYSDHVDKFLDNTLRKATCQNDIRNQTPNTYFISEKKISYTHIKNTLS